MGSVRSYEDQGMSERARVTNDDVERAESAYYEALRRRAMEARAQIDARNPAQVVAIRFGVSRQTIYTWIKHWT